MGFRFVRRNRIDEMHTAGGKVIADESAGDGVDNAKGFRLGRAIRLQRATNDFDGGNGGEFLSGNGFCGKRKNKFDAIAGLARSEERRVGKECREREALET